DLGGYRGYQVLTDKKLFVDDQNSGLVRVQYDILERGPATVGEIYIKGNEVTKNRVIIRGLTIFPGEVLQYPELRASSKNLERMNIFEINPELGIRPTVTEIPNDHSNVKDILI